MEANVSQSPSGDLVAVTPHNTNPIVAVGDDGKSKCTRGLYIGGAGNVAVITRAGQTVTLSAMAVGVVHPIQVSHVKSTNTTATNIVALF